jgi:hypothetical protein
MARGRPSTFVFFKCPNCKALCQLIKVEAGPETVDRQITCVLCGALFPGREGRFIPKYILLRKAARPGPRPRGRSQRPKNSH